jgi:hypothetical protein
VEKPQNLRDKETQNEIQLKRENCFFEETFRFLLSFCVCCEKISSYILHIIWEVLNQSVTPKKVFLIFCLNFGSMTAQTEMGTISRPFASPRDEDGALHFSTSLWTGQMGVTLPYKLVAEKYLSC